MQSVSWTKFLVLVFVLVVPQPLLGQAAEPESLESATAPILGESNRDLLFTPVTPCRLFDTRLAGGALAAGVQRDFLVTGNDLSAQGGSATGCGIPFGPTSAVLVNFVAVSATGSGNLQAWAWTPSSPPAPNASILNFNSSFNIANGIAVPICDPIIHAECDSELLLRANVNSTHIVADVVGYFRRFPTGQASFTAAKATSETTVIGTTCTHQTGAELTVFTLPIIGTVLVRANVWLQLNHQNATDDTVELYIGTSPTDCSCSLGFTSSYTIPAEWPSATNVEVTVPVSCSFQAGSGSHTYYLNALSKSGSATTDSILHSGLELIYNANSQP
jgi:hypothetical protein